MTVHGLCTDCAWLCTGCPSHPQDSLKIIFKIIVYAIMVSQGRRAANVGPVHGVCMCPIAPVASNWSRCLFRTWYQFVMGARWTTLTLYFPFYLCCRVNFPCLSGLKWSKAHILSTQDWRWSARKEFYTQNIIFCCEEWIVGMHAILSKILRNSININC